MQDLSKTIIDNIDNLTAPNGRIFKIVQYPQNPALYQIAYGDNKSGELPAVFKDHLFTKGTLAKDYIKRNLADMWQDAESRLTTRQKSTASA